MGKDRGRAIASAASTRRAGRQLSGTSDHEDTPVVGGARPHVSVIVDWQTLTNATGAISELDDGTVLHPETVRRLACDAVVTRIVTGPDSRPLV